MYRFYVKTWRVNSEDVDQFVAILLLFVVIEIVIGRQTKWIDEKERLITKLIYLFWKNIKKTYLKINTSLKPIFWFRNQLSIRDLLLPYLLVENTNLTTPFYIVYKRTTIKKNELWYFCYKFNIFILVIVEPM